MIKKQFSPVQLVLTLVLVCSGAALALAVVHEITLLPIAEAKRQAQLKAIREVLPEFSNDPAAEALVVTLEDGKETNVYPARDAEGTWIALAVKTAGSGYGAKDLEIMTGLDASGTILKLKLLPGHEETPGLGDAVGKEKFLTPLLGQDGDSIVWQVKKDGGQVDAVTAATISSRAAVKAIAESFAVFKKAREQHESLK